MAFFLLYCVFGLWLGEVAGVILCDETCASPDRGNASVCLQEKDSRREIALLGLFPCNTDIFQARGLTVAGQMAVRQISYNNSTNLLQNYRLKLYVENSQCASLPAVRAFIDNLDPQRNRTFHMVLGPGCSSGATVVAPLANAWNLTTVSFTASSPSFSDKTKFPNFLRTISSDIEAFTVQAALINEYGWKQVALLTEFTSLFTSLQEEQVRELSAMGTIVYKFQLSGVEMVEQRVAEILLSGARVVIVNTFESFARNVFCEVYRQNRANLNSFVWIVYGWYTETWLDGDLPAGCTREMLYTVANRVLAVDHYPLPTPEESNAATNVTYTPNEFWSAFEDEVSDLNYPATEAIGQARYVYDAVWLAAFMFESGLQRLREEFGMELEDIDYSSRNFTQILLEESRRISFRGVSGLVSLNENGDRTPSFRVSQWRVNNGSVALHAFASLSEGRQLVYRYSESEATVWPDGVPQDFEEDSVELWLLVVLSLLSAGGIGFAIVCIVFDLVFRKKRLVKVTSPYLNVIIDIGIILIFLIVIFLGIGGQGFLPIISANAFCMLNIWIASIAFTVVFSPLFAKTFRVYWIFSRSKKMAKAKPFKDWILFLIVAVVLALDVVFLTFVTAFDSSRLEVETQLLQRSGGAVPNQIRICTAQHGIVWVPILFVLKGIFLLSGVFLAVQTWNIKLKSINDSQLIAVAIVAVFFATVVAAMVAFFLRDMVDLAYGITAGCGIIVGYLLLCLLYLKKMHTLRKHPDGVLESLGESTEVSLATATTQASTERTNQLQQELESLRKQADQLRRRAGVKQPVETSAPGIATPTPSRVSFVDEQKSSIDLVPIR